MQTDLRNPFFFRVVRAICPGLPANFASLHASQKELAQPRREGEVEHALKRRLCQPVRVRWRWPRAAERCACNCWLDRDSQHTPNALTAPQKGCPDGGRRTKRAALVPADFGSQHEEALGSSPARFRVGGVFAAFGPAGR